MSKQPKQFFEFGPFRLDAERGRLTRSGEIVLLPPKAISLLLVLLKHQGQVVEKETILETVWPDTVVEDSNLTQTIHLIRKAISKNGASEPRIETLPKIGYRIIANARLVTEQSFTSSLNSPGNDENLRDDTPPCPAFSEEDYPKAKLPSPVHEFVSTGVAPAVLKSLEFATEETERSFTPDQVVRGDKTRLSGDGQVVMEEEESPVAEANGLPAPPPPTLAWWQNHNVRIGVLALAGIIFGLALGFKLMHRGMAPGKLDSVAVLPFSSAGGKKADLSVSMRMAEALIAKLDSAKKISVRPPAAIRGYYDENTDPIKAGLQLGVDAVITGEALNQNGRLFVRVRLLRVADGQPLFDEEFEEPLSLPSKLENIITDKITTALDPPGGGH